MRTPWTDERVSLLTKWWREGLSGSRIAVLLGGVSRNGVIGKVHRLGLPERRTLARTAYARPKKRKRRARKSNPNSGSLRPETEAASAEPPVRLAPPRPREGMPEGAVEAVRALPAMGVCRYPIGDPKAEGFRFCGDMAKPGSAYCIGHSNICFVPADTKQRRKQSAYAEPRHKEAVSW